MGRRSKSVITPPRASSATSPRKTSSASLCQRRKFNSMSSLRNSRLLVFTVGLIVTCCSVAHAHPHHGEHGTGLTDGLLHPLLGIDHLLAMVATGLLAAQLGGKALWAVPASFVGSMVLGGISGMTGIGMPGVELGIALSIVVLG